jgi:hypothetical protein
MDNHQAVPKSPRLGIKAYIPGYKAIYHAPHSIPSLTLITTCERTF